MMIIKFINVIEIVIKVIGIVMMIIKFINDDSDN